MPRIEPRSCAPGRRVLVAALVGVCLLAGGAVAVPAATPQAPDERLGRELQRLVDAFPGRAGVAVQAAEAFYEDGFDSAAAADMNDLLVRIARGEILTAASCETILEILTKTQTGANRLRGLLPAETTLAHKTGTIGRVVNDVGIVELPGKLGRFAISVYTVADQGVEPAVNERLIADLARTSYDFFLFHAVPDAERSSDKSRTR